MKRYIYVALAALTLAGCAREDITTSVHLRLSDSQFTFDATGNQTCTVTVESSVAEWSVETENDWLTVSRTSDEELTITAAANETHDERFGLVTVKNGFSERTITLNQFGKEQPGIPKYRLMAEFSSFEISPGGKKGLGVRVSDTPDWKSNSVITVIDLATDERTQLTSFEGADTPYLAGAISDDGSVVILNGNFDMKAVRYNHEEAEWEPVASPNGELDAQCIVQGISSDGRIWVGFCQSGMYFPVKWVDGVPQMLDAPYEDGMGRPVTVGSMARGCSADGSVIYGSLWGNSTESVYWKADGTWAFVAEELLVKKTITIDPGFGMDPFEVDYLDYPKSESATTCLSPNGKYLALAYVRQDEVDGIYFQHEYPLFVDLETGEYTLLDDAGIGYGLGMGISDDGTCFYALRSDVGSPIDSGHVYDPATSTSTPTSDWIRSTCGIYMTGNYCVTKVYGGGNTIAGLKIIPTAFGVQYMPWYITKEGV